MARPIKETPILFGEDALKFQMRMSQQRTETTEARERRLRNYEEIINMLEKGMSIKMPTKKMSIDEANRILSK